MVPIFLVILSDLVTQSKNNKKRKLKHSNARLAWLLHSAIAIVRWMIGDCDNDRFFFVDESGRYVGDVRWRWGGHRHCVGLWTGRWLLGHLIQSMLIWTIRIQQARQWGDILHTSLTVWLSLAAAQTTNAMQWTTLLQIFKCRLECPNHAQL